MERHLDRRAAHRKIPHVAKGGRTEFGLDRVSLTTLTRLANALREIDSRRDDQKTERVDRNYATGPVPLTGW